MNKELIKSFTEALEKQGIFDIRRFKINAKAGSRKVKRDRKKKKKKKKKKEESEKNANKISNTMTEEEKIIMAGFSDAMEKDAISLGGAKSFLQKGFRNLQGQLNKLKNVDTNTFKSKAKNNINKFKNKTKRQVQKNPFTAIGGSAAFGAGANELLDDD